MQDLLDRWRRAARAELAWIGPDGRPRWERVIPLSDGRSLLVALPYSLLDLARRAVGGAAIALPGGDGRIARVSVEVTEDPDGSRFEATLLPEAALKDPHTEQLLGALLARRDHWWLLPRLLLTLTPVGEVASLHGGEGALVTARLDIAPITVDHDGGAEVRLRSRLTLPTGPVAAAAVTVDERRVALSGTLDRARLAVAERVETSDDRRLLPRLRELRRLRRACRAGLRAAGHLR